MRRRLTHKFHSVILFFFIGTFAPLSQAQNIEWSGKGYLITANNSDIKPTSNISEQDAVFVCEQVGRNTSDSDFYILATPTENWSGRDSKKELNNELSLDKSSVSISTTEMIENIIVVNNKTNNPMYHIYSFYIKNPNEQLIP